MKKERIRKLLMKMLAALMVAAAVFACPETAFAEDGKAASLTAEEHSMITKQDALRVGYMENYLPFSSTDESGNPTGIVKDYVPLMIRNIGLSDELAPVYVGYRENDDLYAALRNGEIDVAFPAYGDPTYARAKHAAFSESIISISIDLAYRDSYTDDTTDTIAVNNGNHLQEYYSRYYYPDSQIVYFDTIGECLDAVAAGKVGTTFLNGLRTSALLSGEYTGKLKSARLPYGVDFGFAVNADNPVMLSVINKAIENTDPAAAFTYSYSYVDSIKKYTAKDFLMENLAWIIIAAAAVILVIFMLIYRQRKQREYEEQLRKDQIARMAGGVSTYILNPETGRFQILGQNKYLAENYTDSEDFNTSITRYIENDVFEPDRGWAKKALSIPAILKALETQDEYRVEFRDATGEIPHWYQMRAVRLSDSEILYSFTDMDEKIIDDMLYEKMRENYFGLYYVNLDTGIAQIIKTGHPEITGNVGEAVAYDVLISSIARASGEDGARFMESIRDIDYVREHFATVNLSYNVYKSNIFEGDKWVNATGHILARHEDGTPSILALGFILLDDEASEKEEAKLKLEESMKIVGGLADEYVAIYYLDLKTGLYQNYYATEMIADTAKKFDTYPKLIDLFNSFVDSESVHPDYRQQLHEFYPDDATMRDTLKDRKETNSLFLRNYGGEYLWTEIRAARCEDMDEELEHIVFGVAEIDREVRERAEQLREAEEINKLVESIAEKSKVVFTVNMQDDSFRPLKVDKDIKDKFEAFTNFIEAKESLFEILHKSDRERMMNELEYSTIRERVKEEGSYAVNYRTVINGATKWHEMNVTPVDVNEVAMGFSEKDLEITKRLLSDLRFNEYFALFVADIDTGMIRIVKNDGHHQIVPIGESAPYTQYINGIAEALEGEPREFYRTISNLENIKSNLASDDKRSYSYKSDRIGGGNTWVDVTCYVILRHEDGTPAMFTLGFSVADALAAESNELQSRLKENMQMIAGLAREYDALYYINIDEHVFDIYTLNEEMYPGSRDVVWDRTDFYAAIRGYGLSEHVHPDDRHLFNDFDAETIRRELTGRKTYSIRFRMNTDSGYRWNEMDVVKYEDVDQTANAVTVGFADRDSEIRMEQEHQIQLEEARNAAEAANKSKTSFLFNMSHDIRTPMNAITGFTSMAKKHIDDTEKVNDYLDKIDMSGQQLLTLVNQVLEMARIESGRIELEDNHVNVRDEYEAAVTVLAEQAKVNGLSFHHSLSDVTHYNILADMARMNSITLNIAGNALKYTPRGGNVDFLLREIPSAREGYATFVFTVEDTGIGMSEDYQKVLFDPFTREQNSTVSRIQGTGLGMSIVKELVDILEGKIEVKSEPGKGTRFDITIDFRIDEKASGSKEAEGAGESMTFAGRRVLLVEDNELNREIANEILSEEGITVDDADDGTTAVDVMKEKGPDYYDFILMDIQMPQMNGYEATKVIREMYPDKHIPIIALSANAFAEDKVTSLAAGMDDHVAKPINIKELFGALEKFL